MSAKRIIFGLALVAALAPAAAAEPFKVSVDQTLTLKLPSPANSVVIGNATIADVAVHDASTLLVTGKTFGATNIMVLDGSGRTIYENQINVGHVAAQGELTVVRGTDTFTYSCIGKCRATPMVGDNPDHYNQARSSGGEN
jgi:Flp pilus assembly secretin CpaC